MEELLLESQHQLFQQLGHQPSITNNIKQTWHLQLVICNFQAFHSIFFYLQSTICFVLLILLITECYLFTTTEIKHSA